VATDVVVAGSPALGGGALTRRASLTAAAALLDFATKAAVGLIVTPVLVSGLGRSLFGVWEMLGRLIGYMSAADGRPTEALRLVIAQRQGDEDVAASRQYVGGAVVVWVLLVPLVALLGGVLSWYAPALTHAPAGQWADIRLTSALLVGSFLLGSLAAIPESVLRGMNLGYRRMGLQAGLSILGGVLAVGAVSTGLGLPGLGSSMIVRAVLTGLCFWLLVRRYVWWFGVARPARAHVRSLLRMSVWLSAGDLVTKLLLASDVLILGAVIAPAAVTTYALTSYAARTALGIHIFTAGAAIPGLGGLLGSRQHDRAARARGELLILTWLFGTVVGTTILLWNRSFLELWVGAGHYAGPWVDLLIVLITVQTAFIRTDAYVIDAALRPERRVLVGALAATVTLGLGIALTRAYGIIGLCLGVLAGRAIQSVAYPALVRTCLGRTPASPALGWRAVRLTLTTGLLFTAAAAGGPMIEVTSWLLWLAAVTATAIGVGIVALAAGPEATTRRAVLNRVRATLPARFRL
jgi:O-antigen/teichoic acid export membrane protein